MTRNTARKSPECQAARHRLGVLEWLRPGEYDHAEEMVRMLRELHISFFRTGLSWADWHTPEGKKWFDWVIPTLAKEVDLLPCFTYTPPSLGLAPKTSAPPKNPKDYADFIDMMITDYGRYFDWLELWNEPNNINDWDWRLDPDWNIFSEMIGMAAYWAHQRGKKTVLAGMAPTDPNWLHLLSSRGTLAHIDAVGLHCFAGTWEFDEESLSEKVATIREVLKQHNLAPELWLTEVGYSTWRYDEMNQIRMLLDTLTVPVERIYWYSGYDLHPQEEHQDGFHEDERHYHFGMMTADGSPKLLYRIVRDEGIQGLVDLAECVVRQGADLQRKPPVKVVKKSAGAAKEQSKPVLITGGAGFIGTNLAERLLQQGDRILIFDNLGRVGVQRNLEWLCRSYGSRVQVEIADIRNAHLVRDAVHRASRVYHFAAQVAVTTSLDSPQQDFDINLRGTLNILDALREMADPPALLFTSTNKVYGALDDVVLQKTATRYQPVERRHAAGIDEGHNLDFHSPYGCSKGAADQYVLDYVRSYGIQAVVFRMSCIYGPHQFGNEDQGWVAHFLIQALKNQPLTLYGDGCQVRDILYVGDLLEAMLLATKNIAKVSGRAFNIGGGPANSISLLELLQHLDALGGNPCRYSFSEWRKGDQKYYVTDTALFQALTGWKPATDIGTGLQQLYAWINLHLLGRKSPAKAKSSALAKGQYHAPVS